MQRGDNMKRLLLCFLFIFCVCSSTEEVIKKNKIIYHKNIFFDVLSSDQIWSRIHYFVYSQIGSIDSNYHPYYIHAVRKKPYYQEINIFREKEKDKIKLIIEYSEAPSPALFTISPKEIKIEDTKKRLLLFMERLVKYLETGKIQ
jgi:hypothetical protein